ncbi:MAG: hypothetical protein KF791_07965, partial [Verrucomicrobiae bacterium]|nr:hypothetical protein [Verrucomicrobiae bacterium]
GRNRPGHVRAHLREFFNLGAEHVVTVAVTPEGGGKVGVNTIRVGPGEPGVPEPAFPWTGSYFGGLPLKLRALPAPGYAFSHWTGDVPVGMEASETLEWPLDHAASVTAVFVPGPTRVVRQYWSFNEVEGLLEAQWGAGAMGLRVVPGPTTAVVADSGQEFAGINAQGDAGAGTHLRVNNPVGTLLEVALPTTGLDSVVVQYETRRSGQGARTQQVSYTTDGEIYQAFRTVTVMDAAPAVVRLDFSGVAGVADNPLFGIRIAVEQGGGGTAGNNRFDNLTLEGRTGGGDALGVRPELTPMGVIRARVGESLTRMLEGTDADGPASALEFELVKGPAELTLSAVGMLAWTPPAGLAGTTQVVLVRVRDGFEPSLSTLGRVEVRVEAGNTAPVVGAVADLAVEELTPLTLQLEATDAEQPVQTLTYWLLGGPAGMTVSAAGLLNWTPTEAQGPGQYPVTVLVTDNGARPLGTQVQFTVGVSEVNQAPVLAAVADREVNALSPLTVQLEASDGDVPAQTLMYGLVSGPEGLTVSAEGLVSWTATLAQAPGTYGVSVQVSDNGTPPLSDTKSFNITVSAPTVELARTMWMLGVDDDPAVQPYRPTAEFGAENGRNDAPPGRVSRLPGDPQYVAETNPGSDDDHYFAGVYPAGFNGLSGALQVPNDEPWWAWERAHTIGDRTNRVHLVLGAAQVAAAARVRITMELVNGGWMLNGVKQPGFGDHDMVVRFRNQGGAGTVLWSGRISQTTNLVMEVLASAVQASAGANTIEIVRTGPAGAGLSYWIQYDYLRVQALPGGGGNTPPALAEVGDQSVAPLSPLTLQLEATDGDEPAQTLTYGLVSGPEGLSVSPGGLLAWTPPLAQGPGEYPVTVQVTDSGTPPLSDTKSFNITVTTPAVELARTVWMLGVDDDPAVLPYRPTAEFSQENKKNDAPPGLVSRLPGDPEYLAGSNPVADDDYYFAGVYPAGFNGLSAERRVPNDEPWWAWERAHTIGDRTNRVHLVLGAAQVAAGARLRVSTELVSGGWMLNSVSQPGFGDHDMVVRFRNRLGVGTVLWSGRVSQTTNLVMEVLASAVQASAGANSIEIVRTGPAGAGYSYWVQYDYLRVEALGGGNQAPVLAAVADREVSALSPLTLQLEAGDGDVPGQTLTYGLVSGPAGLTVSSGGLVQWTPTLAQAPGAYGVSVRVTDNGTPPLSDTKSFNVTVTAPTVELARTVWMLGLDDHPAVLPYTPTAEFSAENGRNDAPPGNVSRIPGDPQYVAGTNPGADDDYYFAGVYPAGFNGLTGERQVPNDEPWWAWERAHTIGDRTNRVHLVFGAAQVAAAARVRITMELVNGGWMVSGVKQPGFGDHDMVVRFRNQGGAGTVLWSGRISQTTNLVMEVLASAVQASAGANSIEIVRTGPSGTGLSYWVQYDYLRVEALPASGSGAGGTVATARVRAAPSASGSSRLRLASIPEAVNGVVTLNGWDHLTLTYDRPEPMDPGVRFIVEASRDLTHWVEVKVLTIREEFLGDHHQMTVMDPVPLEQGGPRFLRIRTVADERALQPY